MTVFETDRQYHEHQELIEGHQFHLRQFILMICPNQSSVDDILQQTNQVLWEKRAVFVPGTNFLAWARTVAKLQTLSYLKNAKRASWLRFDSDLVQAIAENVDTRDEQREVRAKALGDCILQLSGADRALVNLRYNNRLSLRQVGQETSRSEGALKQVFSRIRAQLRRCIDTKVFTAQHGGMHE